MAGYTLLSVGEALYDVYPDGREILGGSPLNLALHAATLASGRGRSFLVSRVGADARGRAAYEELKARGVEPAFQQDPALPTGTVKVTIGSAGPEFEIGRPAAWDALEMGMIEASLAGEADGVAFGTLALRDPRSRSTILAMLDHSGAAVKLLDVNLRPPWVDAQVLREAISRANVLKVSEAELREIATRLGVPREPEAFRKALGQDLLVLTRGAAGTVLSTCDGAFEGAPASFPMEPDADAVGAGDAAAAAVLVGLLDGLSLPETADLANRAGAYVASRAGATPILRI
jgi:fructokinase